MIRKALPLALLLALAACARSESASLVPADTNEARPVETVRPERDDQEAALGEWRETLQEAARALEFGPRGTPPVFSLRCDARRGLLLQRHGSETVGDLPVMLVTVGSETRRLAVTTTEGPVAMLRATINAGDPFVAALSGATVPITVRIGDTPPLVLPPSPLIGTYIGQCASGTLPTASLPAPDANANQAAPAANAAAPTGNAVAGD